MGNHTFTYFANSKSYINYSCNVASFCGRFWGRSTRYNTSHSISWIRLFFHIHVYYYEDYSHFTPLCRFNPLTYRLTCSKADKSDYFSQNVTTEGASRLDQHTQNPRTIVSYYISFIIFFALDNR